jgi:hypothetical protein
MTYAAGAVAAGLAAPPSAEAAVNYTAGPFPFGVNSEFAAPLIDFDNNGDDEFTIAQERQVAGNDQTDRVLLKELETQGATGAGYVTGPGSFPAALASGATIGPAQTYGNAFSDNVSNQLIDEDYDNDGVFQSYSGNFTPDGVAGNTEYIGVKFRLNDNEFGDLHYGWVGIDITNQADLTGVVTGYAYETTPDTAITAGAVPEPSGLALLALGAAGLLIRRKQVA